MSEETSIRELPPCPLCGNKNLKVYADSIDIEFNTRSVICAKCSCKAPLHQWVNRSNLEQPTIRDYIKANEPDWKKCHRKMVNTSSLYEFIGEGE